MTLRGLKKLSKAAQAILLRHYGYTPERFFLAKRGANYHGYVVRCSCPAARRATDRHHVVRQRQCNHQSHPLKGTPMLGEMSGYYEPEWDERTAFEQLSGLVMWDDRPKSIDDAEWRRILHLTGVTPVDVAELEAEWESENCPSTSTTPATATEG